MLTTSIRSRWSTAVCLAAGILVFATPSAAREEGVYPRLPRSGENHLWYVSNDTDTAIIFVHGIFSSSRSAWLNENGAYWPRIVAEDPLLGRPSIYLGGFHTALDSGPYSIRDAANELYRRLTVDDVLSRRKLLFIAHSMGGIVVRHLLVRKREELADKTVGLMLMASPSVGSRDATRLRWLSELAANQMGSELAWDHPFLEELDREFKDLVYRQRIPCMRGIEAVEHHLVGSVLWGLLRREVLVEMSSAGRYFGDPQRLPGTDHFTIVKPDSKHHPAHALLQGFYRTDFVRPCEAVGDGSGKTIETSTARDPGRFALRTEADTFYSEIGHSINVPLRVVRLTTGNAPPSGFTLRTLFLEEDGTPLDQDTELRAFVREASEASLPPMAVGTHEQTANLRIGTQEAGRFGLRIELAVDDEVLTSLELDLVVDALPFADLIASSTAEIPHYLLRNHLLTLDEGVFDDYEEVAVTLVDEAYRSNLEQATIYLDPTYYGSTGPTLNVYSYPLPEGKSHRGYHRSPLGTTLSDTVPIGAGFYAFEQIDGRRLRFIPVPANCRHVQVRLDRFEHPTMLSEPAPSPSLTEIAIDDYRRGTATFYIAGSEESFSLFYDCGASGAACGFDLQWGESTYWGREDYGELNLAASNLPIIRAADYGAYWVIEADQADRYDTRLTASRCQPGTAH